PYRLHLHRRIAREMPEVRLRSLYTHEASNAPWRFSPEFVDEIGAVQFGKGESSDVRLGPIAMLREWIRAGRLIALIRAHQTQFVVLGGYNDIGLVRILLWCRRAHIPCWLFGDSNILCDVPVGLKALIKAALVKGVVALSDGILCCGTLGHRYFVKYGA